jgi:hypothetical protein
MVAAESWSRLKGKNGSVFPSQPIMQGEREGWNHKPIRDWPSSDSRMVSIWIEESRHVWMKLRDVLELFSLDWQSSRDSSRSFRKQKSNGRVARMIHYGGQQVNKCSYIPQDAMDGMVV